MMASSSILLQTAVNRRGAGSCMHISEAGLLFSPLVDRTMSTMNGAGSGSIDTGLLGNACKSHFKPLA
jgi:hypothetical protein